MAKSAAERPAGGHAIDFGDNVRIDRRFKPEQDGSYLWHVYKRAKVKDNVHPVHGEHTTDTHVWMPEAEGVTEEEARELAKRLAK